MKRTARAVIEAGVPILGITTILGSVLLNPVNVQLHVTVLLIGVLILLTGPPWKLMRAVLPWSRDGPVNDGNRVTTRWRVNVQVFCQGRADRRIRIDSTRRLSVLLGW